MQSHKKFFIIFVLGLCVNSFLYGIRAEGVIQDEHGQLESDEQGKLEESEDKKSLSKEIVVEYQQTVLAEELKDYVPINITQDGLGNVYMLATDKQAKESKTYIFVLEKNSKEWDIRRRAQIISGTLLYIHAIKNSLFAIVKEGDEYTIQETNLNNPIYPWYELLNSANKKKHVFLKSEMIPQRLSGDSLDRLYICYRDPLGKVQNVYLTRQITERTPFPDLITYAIGFLPVGHNAKLGDYRSVDLHNKHLWALASDNSKIREENLDNNFIEAYPNNSTLEISTDIKEIYVTADNTVYGVGGKIIYKWDPSQNEFKKEYDADSIKGFIAEPGNAFIYVNKKCKLISVERLVQVGKRAVVPSDYIQNQPMHIDGDIEESDALYEAKQNDFSVDEVKLASNMLQDVDDQETTMSEQQTKVRVPSEQDSASGSAVSKVGDLERDTKETKQTQGPASTDMQYDKYKKPSRNEESKKRYVQLSSDPVYHSIQKYLGKAEKNRDIFSQKKPYSEQQVKNVGSGAVLTIMASSIAAYLIGGYGLFPVVAGSLGVGSLIVPPMFLQLMRMKRWEDGVDQKVKWINILEQIKIATEADDVIIWKKIYLISNKMHGRPINTISALRKHTYQIYLMPIDSDLYKAFRAVVQSCSNSTIKNSIDYIAIRPTPGITRTPDSWIQGNIMPRIIISTTLDSQNEAKKSEFSTILQSIITATSNIDLTIQGLNQKPVFSEAISGNNLIYTSDASLMYKKDEYDNRPWYQKYLPYWPK